MSLARISDECAGMDGEFVFGRVTVPPDHDACPGGSSTPGLIGGWFCTCGCHTTPPENADADG